MAVPSLKEEEGTSHPALESTPTRLCTLGLATGATRFWNFKKLVVGHWRLMPVILASWETEIRRTEVQDQLRQTVLETPSLK
jgi:hypothetical protein